MRGRESRLDGKEVHAEGTVDVYEMLGSDAIVHVNQRDTDRQLIANIDAANPIQAGEKVRLNFNTAKLHIFDKATGQTITN